MSSGSLQGMIFINRSRHQYWSSHQQNGRIYTNQIVIVYYLCLLEDVERRRLSIQLWRLKGLERTPWTTRFCCYCQLDQQGRLPKVCRWFLGNHGSPSRWETWQKRPWNSCSWKKLPSRPTRRHDSVYRTLPSSVGVKKESIASFPIDVESKRDQKLCRLFVCHAWSKK